MRKISISTELNPHFIGMWNINDNNLCKNIIKFFEGVSGSFQLTQAQQQLYQAQQSKIQSMRAVIIEKTNLENILNNKN